MPSPSSHTELPDSSSLRHILAVAHSPVAEPGVARTLATELGLDWLGVVAPKQVRDYGLLLFMDEHGLALQQTGKGAPGPVKEDATKEEADEIKAKLEEAGASVEIK